MADARRFYSDSPLLEEVPYYNIDLLRMASNFNFKPDANNTLAYKLLEDERQKLLQRKDDLALKSAKCKFPSEKAVAVILEAEKANLAALLEQREAINLSYLRENHEKRQQEIWDSERAKEHFEKNLGEHYSHRAELVKDKMTANVEGIRRLNAQLAAQNARLADDIQWLAVRKQQTLCLAEQVGCQKEDILRDDINRQARLEANDEARKNGSTKSQLIYLIHDLEARLHLLSVEADAISHRNAGIYMHPRELAYRLKAENLSREELEFDKIAFHNVNKALKDERVELATTLEHLQAVLEGDKKNHEAAKRLLFSSRSLARLDARPIRAREYWPSGRDYQ
jgi:hypothetical protein